MRFVPMRYEAQADADYRSAGKRVRYAMKRIRQINAGARAEMERGKWHIIMIYNMIRLPTRHLQSADEILNAFNQADITAYESDTCLNGCMTFRFQVFLWGYAPLSKF